MSHNNFPIFSLKPKHIWIFFGSSWVNIIRFILRSIYLHFVFTSILSTSCRCCKLKNKLLQEFYYCGYNLMIMRIWNVSCCCVTYRLYVFWVFWVPWTPTSTRSTSGWSTSHEMPLPSVSLSPSPARTRVCLEFLFISHSLGNVYLKFSLMAKFCFLIRG